MTGIQRHNTQAQSTFTRGRQVIYELPSPAYSKPSILITLPPKSRWTSGLHFHKTHTEYLSVIQGAASITLNGTTRTHTPSDGVLTIYAYTRHSWCRASPDGEELIVREWTDPEDGQKEIFFRNLNSVLAEGETGHMLTLQLHMISWASDNWPIFFSCAKVPIVGGAIETLVTHLVLFFAVLVGTFMELETQYEAYTPALPAKRPWIGQGIGAYKDEEDSPLLK